MRRGYVIHCDEGLGGVGGWGGAKDERPNYVALT